MQRSNLILVLLVAVVFSKSVIADDSSFILEDIKIEGLQRVSSASVFSAINLTTGQQINQYQIASNIRSIFALGLFDQVTASVLNGNILVFKVEERPSISELEIEGNKALKTEDLLKSLSENGISEGNIYNPVVINGVKSALEREYVSQGHYTSSVEAELEYLPRNRVRVKILVDEGKKTVIRRINIIGNKIFNDEELLKVFELRKAGFFAAFSKKNKYSKAKLEEDLENLESFYLDKGYLEFAVNSVQVSISPDKKSIYISIHINEGQVFTVGNVELLGDLKIPEARLKALIFIKEGERFSQFKLTTIEDWINQLHSNAGYSFSEVNIVKRPRTTKTIDSEIDDNNGSTTTTNIVDIDFLIDPGSRTYVRRIEFKGNIKTKDEVLRREILQYEAAPASKNKIEYSKTKLERLVNFSTVSMEEIPVAGTDDQIDVIYAVEEQSSGSISGSIGYSDLYKTTLQASLGEQNFLGTGNAVSFNVSRSSFQESVSLSYSNPFLTLDGINSSVSLVSQQSDYASFNLSRFATNSLGLNFNIGYPIGNTQRIQYGLNANRLEILVGAFAPEEITLITDSDVTFDSLNGSLYWRQSALNRGLLATGGYSQSLGVDFSLPFSELKYYKLNYSTQFFLPIKDDWVVKFRNDFGYGDGYGETSRLPFFKNFYAGGFGTVRGFEGNSLGPRETPGVTESVSPAFDENGNVITDELGNRLNFSSYTYTSNYARVIGGNIKITGTVELLLGFGFLSSNRTLQASLFFDYGNIFDTYCGNYPERVLDNGAIVPVRHQEHCYRPTIKEFRYSAGLGLSWISPLGPMSFSFGETFNENTRTANGRYSIQPEDSKFFQFTVGRLF